MNIFSLSFIRSSLDVFFFLNKKDRGLISRVSVFLILGKKISEGTKFGPKLASTVDHREKKSILHPKLLLRRPERNWSRGGGREEIGKLNLAIEKAWFANNLGKKVFNVKNDRTLNAFANN